jgi:uncharacterized protein involved in exopolysaccharide biosynthesis
MEQNTHNTYRQEETIDLRELFAVLKRRKKLIGSVTALFILLVLTYIFIAKPIYEVRADIELAQINKKSVQETETIKHKIEVMYDVNNKNKKIIYPRISALNLPKKTSNILTISAQGYDNITSKDKLQDAIDYINTIQNKDIDNYIKIQKKKLSLTQRDIEQTEKLMITLNTYLSNYTNKLLNISKEDAALAAIYSIEIGKKESERNALTSKIYALNNTINTIEQSISPLNIKRMALIGTIQISDKPIKPKKLLIFIVAFITGLMLSVFLAFFMEFLDNTKRK